MDDEDPRVFKVVIGWMYTQHLAYPPEEEMNLGLDFLFNIYVFGEKRIIPKLQNHVLSKIIQQCEYSNTVPLYLNGYAYANTTQSSPLRKLLVDYNIYLVDHEDWKPMEDPNQLALADFFLDIIKEMRRNREDLFPATWSYFKPSNYFVHDDITKDKPSPS